MIWEQRHSGGLKAREIGRLEIIDDHISALLYVNEGTTWIAGHPYFLYCSVAERERGGEGVGEAPARRYI